MATCRYKRHPEEPFGCSQFNTHGLGEVLTGDDSAYISELDVFIRGEWKDMRQAFADRDLINDNYFTQFFEPPTPEDKARGFTLY